MDRRKLAEALLRASRVRCAAQAIAIREEMQELAEELKRLGEIRARYERLEMAYWRTVDRLLYANEYEQTQLAKVEPTRASTDGNERRKVPA